MANNFISALSIGGIIIGIIILFALINVVGEFMEDIIGPWGKLFVCFAAVSYTHLVLRAQPNEIRQKISNLPDTVARTFADCCNGNKAGSEPVTAGSIPASAAMHRNPYGVEEDCKSFFGWFDSSTVLMCM